MNAGRITFHLVRFLVFLTGIFPVKLNYALCSFIAFIGAEIKWKRKKIAMDNLKIVFPEKTTGERKSIFRESFANMLKNYFEIAFFVSKGYSSREILQMADATGLEHLDSVVQGRQGALLYSGHFGNFSLMVGWLGFKGYPVAAIYKEAKNFPDGYFGDILRKFNITPLKYQSDASLTVAVIRALKEKKIVLIQNDQSHPRGVYINFFNKNVPSPAGPALLARRAGVPVIPAYIYRDKNNHHHITVLPEITLKQEDDLEKFMIVNTQIMIDWIAGILVKHPAEWLWLHNRFKRARKIEDQSSSG